MLTLRPYQQRLIDQARASFTAGRHAPLLVAPCGAGKTILFSYMASRATERVYILAHRAELLDQISDTLDLFNVPHGFMAAGRQHSSDRVQVCSVQTLARRGASAPGLCIVDEAHHATSPSYRGLLAGWRGTKVIGVTATPERLDGRGLGDVFDDLIIGPSVKQLISQGNLCPFRIYAPSQPDLTGVHTTAGDYNKGELAKAVDKPSVTGSALEHYKRLAAGRRAIVFCTSVQHARNVAMEFQAAGFHASWLDGGMDDGLRKQTVNAFRAGRIRILTSCDLVSEGFDLPAIEVAIMLRPTQSLALWIQQAGRALRTMAGKDEALLLDHAGNVHRHGMPDDDRDWTLEGRPKAKRGSKQEVKVKICPSCFAAQPPGGAVCAFCGFALPVMVRKIEEREGELEEIKAAETVARKQEQGRARTLADLVAVGRSRGMKNPYGWAMNIMAARRRK